MINNNNLEKNILTIFHFRRKIDAKSANYCLTTSHHQRQIKQVLFNYCRLLLKKPSIHKLVILGIISNLLVACTTTPTIQAPQAAKPSKSSAIVSYALSLKGTPYRYGKSSPSEGFDCSGFVKHVYEKNGILLPRTAGEMANKLKAIPSEQVFPGDLLFFNIAHPNSHVGIYIGEENFVHAPSQRSGKVMVSSLKNRYWRKHFGSARRAK